MSNNEWFERGELPPVGIECEYKGHSDIWHKCKIAAHVFEGNRPVAIIQCAISWTYSGNTSGFRPIKTEREKFVDAYCKTADETPKFEKVGDWAAALYDAGFRKKEV